MSQDQGYNFTIYIKVKSAQKVIHEFRIIRTFGGSTTFVFEHFATDPSVGSNPCSPHENNHKRTKEGFARSSLALRLRRKEIKLN